jgi:hypothetical protein
MTMKKLQTILITLILGSCCLAASGQKYENFEVAVYCRAYEVEKMGQPGWLESVWDTLSKQVHVDKIYLETHRDLLIVPDETLEFAKNFFREKGIEVGGGITYTIDESNNIETIC